MKKLISVTATALMIISVLSMPVYAQNDCVMTKDRASYNYEVSLENESSFDGDVVSGDGDYFENGVLPKDEVCSGYEVLHEDIVEQELDTESLSGLSSEEILYEYIEKNLI